MRSIYCLTTAIWSGVLNNTVDPYYILGFDLKDCGINEKVKTPVLLGN